MPIDQESLGAAIKAVRNTRELTQSQLAKRLGFSTGGLALIEQGKRAVSMATLNAISNALEIPPGCLAILGTRTGNKSKPLTDFVESLQQLITTLIVAQQELATSDRQADTNKKAAKKTAKLRNHRVSKATRLVGTLAERPAKGKPARSGSHKVAAGR